jgi:hypothetical protein
MNRRTFTTLMIGIGATFAMPEAAFARRAVPERGAFVDLGWETLDLAVSSSGVVGVPETLAAGRYHLRLQPSPMLGDGQFNPGVLFALLEDGVTVDAVATQAAALQQPNVLPPDWYYTTTSPGGVSGSPDAPAEAVIDLAPGNWIVSANGLSSPPQALTVTGNLDAYLPTPAANATITFRDYSIELTDGQLLTGQNIIMLANEGKLPHFMIGFKGPDGLTREQLGAILDAEMTGTPVASGPTSDAIDYSASFQSIDQSAGTTQWIAVTLEAGTYAAMCWVPEPGTGVPHAFMGMYNVFTVG